VFQRLGPIEDVPRRIRRTALAEIEKTEGRLLACLRPLVRDDLAVDERKDPLDATAPRPCPGVEPNDTICPEELNLVEAGG
jgi:hypothetical protein